MTKNYYGRFEEELIKLKDFIESSKEAKILEQKLKGIESIDYNLIQKQIIEDLESKVFSKEYVTSFQSKTDSWSTQKDNTLNSYLEDRISQVKFKVKKIENYEPHIERFVRVAVKEKNPGKLKYNSIDLDKLAKKILNSSTTKFSLEPTEKKVKDYALKLKELLAYPVKIIDVPVDSYKDEKELRALVSIDPKKYIPQFMKRDITTVKDVYFLTIANVVKFIYKENAEYTPVNRIFTRNKLANNDALKYALFISGFRTQLHSDSTGAIEEAPFDYFKENIETIKNLSSNSPSDGRINEFKIDSRYPLHDELYFEKLDRVPDDELKEFIDEMKYTENDFNRVNTNAKKTIHTILNNPELIKSDINAKDIKNLIKLNLVYGEWIDMTYLGTQGKMEVQIKDPFGFQLYSWNSPIGHNSIAYSRVRNEEFVKELNKKRVDLLVPFLMKKLLLPAFQLDYKWYNTIQVAR